ncbi:MAG TPA: amylo-alpha-1,6-glucosidase [Acetobacteraceae bacterium]|nr:amylo-alpha-1,6-glucosidase [Acetobacteraceae bacterium]
MDDQPNRSENASGPYFISATASFAEARPRALKAGDTFAVFGHDGDATPGEGSAEGIYHRDTRYLSRLALTIAGMAPMLLSSAVSSDNAMLTCDLANPALKLPSAAIEHGQIHIRRSKFLWNGSCYERLTVRNFSLVPLRITLEIAFAADFVDLFEVRGSQRTRHGSLHAPELTAGCAFLAYDGLDERRRATEIRFDPPPAHLHPDRAVYELSLDAGAVVVLGLKIRCIGGEGDEAPGPDDGEIPGFIDAMCAARRKLRTLQGRAASIESDNEVFNEAMRRAVADLAMLVTDTEEGPYPYAGIPWFSTAFGRDGIITGLQTLWLAPGLARGVLLYLAANQATAEDPAADAEPGKILHEVRHGEMALLGEVPFRRYYGSVDSTPLFVMLAGAYLDRTGDLETLRQIWPNLEAALLWIDRYGDADGDGFVEYGRKNPSGLVNQGWKDSYDSIFHADGRLATGPIALCEVQAYVFAARQAAARIAAALGKGPRAASLTAQASALRDAFERSFWDEELGLYVLALDGEKKPCRVSASNAGHALLAGLASPERAASVAARLLERRFFSGWGVRTVAAGEARYNPMSYHNGSVWPHDNAVIAAGFARYGLSEAAARVFGGLFGAASHADLRRLPELFCGFARMRNQGPTAYPVACIPQAWAAGALPAALAACLGLGFDHVARAVTFSHPVLPAFLQRLHLKNLAIGDATIDIVLRRAEAGAVGMAVTARRGDIHAVMTS